jgi:hypothetical protein
LNKNNQAAALKFRHCRGGILDAGFRYRGRSRRPSSRLGLLLGFDPRGEGLSAKLTGGTARKPDPMDQRIEAFLGDVLALAGEEPDAVHKGGAGCLRQVSSGRRRA